MKKKILISLMVVLFLLIIFGTILILYEQKLDDSISLINENVVIEYGNTYHPSIGDLIELSKYDFINTENIRIENSIENEKDKDYPAVGVYELNVYYKKRILKQKVQVIDTIAPELSINDRIELPFGTDLTTYNFKEMITISDLSEVNNYNIDLSKVDTNSSGEYMTKIEIEDIYSNKTEKEFKIVVQQQIKENVIDNTNNIQSNTITKVSKEKEKNDTKERTNNNSISNNTATSTSINNKKENSNKNNQQNKQKEQIVRCTNNSNHGMNVGNSDKWYATKAEAISDYESKRAYWGELWESFKIEKDEYLKKCPYRL